MKYLSYDFYETTVRNVLDAHGIVPDPERRRHGDWLQFIETQQYVTAATDFVHVEMATEYGLERRHLLFFMDIGSRKVRWSALTKSSLPMNGNCGLQSKNTWNIGITTAPTLGSTEI